VRAEEVVMSERKWIKLDDLRQPGTR
jgi:hypothetical protein